MAKFVFRLEVVLKQRKRAEQQAQRELALRQATLVQAQNELKQLDEQVKAATESVRQNHLTGVLDLNFLAAHRRFLNAMQRKGMGIVQRIAVAQKQVDDARAVLAEAAKQRKAIERLREVQHERWRQEQSRRDLAQLDEIGSQIGYHNLVEARAADAHPGDRGEAVRT